MALAIDREGVRATSVTKVFLSPCPLLFSPFYFPLPFSPFYFSFPFSLLLFLPSLLPLFLVLLPLSFLCFSLRRHYPFSCYYSASPFTFIFFFSLPCLCFPFPFPVFVALYFFFFSSLWLYLKKIFSFIFLPLLALCSLLLSLPSSCPVSFIPTFLHRIHSVQLFMISSHGSSSVFFG